MEPKVTVNYLHENKEIIHSMIYYMMKYKGLSQEQKVLKRNNQHWPHGHKKVPLNLQKRHTLSKMSLGICLGIAYLHNIYQKM